MNRLLFAALLVLLISPLSAFGITTDANFDGFVDGLDLGILLGEWDPLMSGISDYNQDGAVDGLDLGILLGQWDPPVRMVAASSIPEPSTATLLLTCCVLPVVARRRR